MRLFRIVGSLGVACLLSTAAHAQWLDDFDTYTPGPLAAQSLWEEWTGSSGVDANVDTARAFSKPNSVNIVATNDVVYDFSNLTAGRPSSGKWILSIKSFVPTGATGSGWYIIMNDYPTNLQWSIQGEFDITSGDFRDATRNKKLKFGKWVSLVIFVDLDANRYDLWYGDKLVTANGTYAAGTGSQQVIAALDLYGDNAGLSSMYFDDARLEVGAGGPLALTSNPNPVASGLNLDLYSNSPLLGAGDPGVLFNWSINGSPLIFPILFTTFDATGTWTLSTTVPVGLSGIEAGLKMLALPAGGKVLISNEDVVIFL